MILRMHIYLPFSCSRANICARKIHIAGLYSPENYIN